jgi:WD40 repeat protein
MSAYQNRKIFAALPRTERGRPIVLGADPKGNNFLYTHGNSVIIRNLANPDISDVYTNHQCQVNVAKYSPSGFYIASADKSGKIRIWDTVNAEHILKSEYQPISGPINDLAWSQDNQRIVCVGEGREKFGNVFLAEMGTTNGDITGQSRPVNSCDIRPNRPFRIITGSEDNSVAFYEGPPFKFKGTKTVSEISIQLLRYTHNFDFGNHDLKAKLQRANVTNYCSYQIHAI